MCGIWGRTRYGKKMELEELLHPVRSLSHRGPDGYRWFSDEQVSLLHTRLSIIDLDGGAQPLSTADGRWVGIVNGELYDYESIRKNLESDGVVFSTRSDSEVLLNLFAKRGASALDDVSGEFAFVFYDRKESLLHFGRDPYGVKPLFYESRPDSFTLSSEMKALQDEKPVFDPAYINSFIGRCMAPPRTALANVEHVWPGRVYTLDLRSRRIENKIYSRQPFFQERHLGGTEALEALDAEIQAAVRRRLKADVEVGCYLSGGVDSALIAALAAESGARPHAFTVGFADRDFDESTIASSIAKDLGLKHSVVMLNSANFMPSLIRSIVAFENPIGNPHGAAKNLLSELASRSVRVVLSGEGADECFGGYAYMRIRKINEFAKRHPRLSVGVRQAFIESERKMNSRHLDGESTAFDELASSFFQGDTPAVLGRIPRQRWYRFVTQESLESRVRDVFLSLSQRLEEELPAGTALNSWDLNAWIGLRSDLLHYILANVGDRQEMSNSLEGRTPFMDPKVVRLAGKILEKDLMRGLTEKSILRRVAARHLGPAHAKRGKRPFFAPMKYLYVRSNRDLFRSYIERARVETPWLNWPGIDRVFSRERRSGNALDSNLISLRLALFSTGVLAEHLRATPAISPRGYPLPVRAEDLLPHRKDG